MLFPRSYCSLVLFIYSMAPLLVALLPIVLGVAGAIVLKLLRVGSSFVFTVQAIFAFVLAIPFLGLCLFYNNTDVIRNAIRAGPWKLLVGSAFLFTYLMNACCFVVVFGPFLCACWIVENMDVILHGLGVFLWGTFRFIAISFAKSVNIFFFLLIFGPFWIAGLFVGLFVGLTSAKKGNFMHNDIGQLPQTLRLEPFNHHGDPDIPKEYVRVRICLTDEISELDISNTETTDTETPDHENEEINQEAMAQIRKRVSDWLPDLDDGMAEDHLTAGV